MIIGRILGGMTVRLSLKHPDAPGMLIPVRGGTNNEGWSTLETAWLPNPDEIARINRGGAIHIMSGVQPPFRVTVGPVEDETVE